MEETTRELKWCLLRLPNEILFRILMVCGIHDLLMIEKTCRTIYALSNSKYLWLSQLSKLDYDHAPDIPPHVDLGGLDTKQVKGLVTRAMRGYDNWASPDGLRFTKGRVFKFGKGDMVPEKILPGCEYIFVRSFNDGYFGLWNIEREILAFRYFHSGQFNLGPYDCTMLRGGNKARLTYSYDGSPQDGPMIEVVDLDLVLDRAIVQYKAKNSKRSLLRTKVKDGFVLAWTDQSVVVIDVDAGKSVEITSEGELVDFDIVRDTLICIFSDRLGRKFRVVVTEISRIFGPADKSSNSLMDICEDVIELYQGPTTECNQYFVSFCDPSVWGSSQPCRILLFSFDQNRDSSRKPYYVQAHRLYLEGNATESAKRLIFDSSSWPVLLEGLDSLNVCPDLPISGHVSVYEWRVSPGKLSKITFHSSRLWENDDRLLATNEDHRILSDLGPSKRWLRVETDPYSRATLLKGLTAKFIVMYY